MHRHRVLICTLLTLSAGLAPAAVVTETVLYEHDGVTLEGYIAHDDATGEQRPGVLVVHQWMGLSDNERMRAEMLAELGYVALAVDIYGQGVRPENTDQAREQAMKYYGDRELYRGRLAAGLAELVDHRLVDARRTAAIGYCFGGAGVLELARSGADVRGVVSFHGNLDTTMPAERGEVAASVLVCHGAVDPYVPAEQVQAFLEEMETAAVDYQLMMYGGAVHAFTQKGAGDDPSRGAAYQATADRRSWRLMRDFFAEVLDD
ncbi:dienelactone hydrolase family protein [bacterium]|nr:dienelactone hydrolase family protein [bacterium]